MRLFELLAGFLPRQAVLIIQTWQPPHPGILPSQGGVDVFDNLLGLLRVVTSNALRQLDPELFPGRPKLAQLHVQRIKPAEAGGEGFNRIAPGCAEHAPNQPGHAANGCTNRRTPRPERRPSLRPTKRALDSAGGRISGCRDLANSR